MGELVEALGISSRALGGGEAVEDEDGCLARHDLPAQHIEQTRQSVLAHGAERANVADPVGDECRVEKRHAAHVLHHARMVLGKQGGIDRSPASRRVVEAELVGKRRLARAGRALDDVKPALEEAATQNGVQAGNAGRHPVQRSVVALAQTLAPTVCMGSVTVNRAPPSGASSTVMLPCMASIRLQTTHSPTPKPLRRSPGPTAR